MSAPNARKSEMAAAKPAVKGFLDALVKQNPRFSKSALKTTGRAVAALFTVAGRLSRQQQQQIAAHEEDVARAVRNAFSEFASRKSTGTDLIVLDIERPVEKRKGEGVGKLLSQREGRKRIENYITPMRLEDWAGPVAGPGEIERKYGTRRSTLHDWQKRGAVVGLLRGERKHAFPLAQFVDGRPIEGMTQVNRIISNPRVAWLWLVRPHSATGGRPPLEYLKEGRIEDVVAVAEHDFG